jgi:DNA-binding HxlR family transcriptional regulator
MKLFTSPVERSLSVLGHRWVSDIFWQLLLGPKRFGELKEAIPGISTKVLTERLRELEGLNFVKREIFAEIPVRVEYKLTERGRSLKPTFDVMCSWGKEAAARRAALPDD